MYKTTNLTRDTVTIGEEVFLPGEETLLTDDTFRRYTELFLIAITEGKLSIRGKFSTSANFNFYNSNKTVGVFIESYDNYSGGRYYIWFLIHALSKLDLNVVVITNQYPVFIKDFIDYSKKNIKFCIGSDLDYRSTLDFAIGVPTTGIIKASEYAQSHNIPLISVIFESPNFNSQYHKEQDSTERYWIPYKRHFARSTFILTISELSKKYVCEWLGFAPERVLLLHPCINSIVADNIQAVEKKNQVVCIGRSVNFKGFDDLKYIVDRLDTKVVLITDAKNKISYKNIEVLSGISDEQKFRVIRESKVLVHTSKFEGFGLTPGEAIYCNTRAITYNLEVYKDFYGTSLEYAQDLDDLVVKVKDSLNNSFFSCDPKVKSKLSFDRFVYDTSIIWSKVDTKHIVTTEEPKVHLVPKITIGIICLNEEEYIESCIKSIYNWDCCHEIFIIEGSTELYRRVNPTMVNEFGNSIDRTVDIIKQFPDTQRKIKFYTGSWKDKFEMRSQYMEKATGEYIFLIDADEFYTPEDLEKLKNYIINNPNIEEIKIRQKIFWHKFDLILGGTFKDLYLERFWKNKDIKLKSHSRVIHKSGRKLELSDPNIYCYHYSNIRKNVDYVKAKCEYYDIRNKEVYHSTLDESIRYNRSWLTWNESIIKLPRGAIVMPYDRESHPEIIKQHPFYTESEKVINSGKLRVGILYHALNTQAVSGGQYAAWRWIESLMLNGVDVTFIGDGFPSYANLEVTKPKFIQINLNRGIYDTLAYPDFIFQELSKKVEPKFDVVLGVASSYLAPMAKYAKKYKIPFVSIVFENPYSLLKYAGEAFRPVTERPDWKNYLDGVIQSDLLICPSDSVLMWTKKWLKDYPDLKMEVVYPPINNIVAERVLSTNPKKKNQLITLGYWAGKKSSGTWLLEASKLLNRKLDIILYSQYPQSHGEYDKSILQIKNDIIIKHNTSEEEKFRDLSESIACFNCYGTGGGDYQGKESFAVNTLAVSFNIPVMIECLGGFGEIIQEGKFWEYARQTKIEPQLEEYLIKKLANKINWLLEHPDYVKIKTTIGHEYIMQNHTMNVIGKQLKDILIKYFK